MRRHKLDHLALYPTTALVGEASVIVMPAKKLQWHGTLPFSSLLPQKFTLRHYVCFIEKIKLLEIFESIPIKLTGCDGDIITYFNAIILLFAFEFHFGSSSNRQ